MRKTRLKWCVRGCLLLMLMALPKGVGAAEDRQAMLYVEMKDGSVRKFQITQDYPIVNPSFVRDGDVKIPNLSIVYFEERERKTTINSSDISRIYTGFETTGIVSRKADEETLSEKVYSLDGRYVGNDSRALEGQPKGVYVVKKGTNYKKIVKP